MFEQIKALVAAGMEVGKDVPMPLWEGATNPFTTTVTIHPWRQWGGAFKMQYHIATGTKLLYSFDDLDTAVRQWMNVTGVE